MHSQRASSYAACIPPVPSGDGFIFAQTHLQEQGRKFDGPAGSGVRVEHPRRTSRCHSWGGRRISTANRTPRGATTAASGEATTACRAVLMTATGQLHVRPLAVSRVRCHRNTPVDASPPRIPAIALPGVPERRLSSGLCTNGPMSKTIGVDPGGVCLPGRAGEPYVAAAVPGHLEPSFVTLISWSCGVGFVWCIHMTGQWR